MIRPERCRCDKDVKLLTSVYLSTIVQRRSQRARVTAGIIARGATMHLRSVETTNGLLERLEDQARVIEVRCELPVR